MKTYNRFLKEQNRGGRFPLPRFPIAGQMFKGQTPRGTGAGAVDRMGDATTRAQQYRLQQINTQQQQAANRKKFKQNYNDYIKNTRQLDTFKGKADDFIDTLMFRPTGSGTVGLKRAAAAAGAGGAGAALTSGYQTAMDTVADTVGQAPLLPSSDDPKFKIGPIEFGGREAQGAYRDALLRSAPLVGPLTARATGQTVRDLTGEEWSALINNPAVRGEIGRQGTTTALDMAAGAIGPMMGLPGKAGAERFRSEVVPELSRAAGEVASDMGPGYKPVPFVTGVGKLSQNIVDELKRRAQKVRSNNSNNNATNNILSNIRQGASNVVTNAQQRIKDLYTNR